METLAEIMRSASGRCYLFQKAKSPEGEDWWHIKEIKEPNSKWEGSDGPLIQFVDPEECWMADIGDDEIKEAIAHHEETHPI